MTSKRAVFQIKAVSGQVRTAQRSSCIEEQACSLSARQQGRGWSVAVLIAHAVSAPNLRAGERRMHGQ